jgi:four-jointed box protein 1
MVREHVLEQMLSLQYLTNSLRMRRTSSFFDMEPSFSVQSLSRDASALEGGGIVCGGGGQSGQQQPQAAGFFPHRASRWLCFLTTCLAFILGVGVGIAVPMLYASSPIEINGNNSRTAAAAPWAVVQDPSSVVHLPLDLTSSGSNASVSNIPARTSARMKAYLRKKEKEMQLTKNQRSSSDDDNVVSFVQTSGMAENKSQEEATVVTGQAVNGIYWSQAVEDILPTGFDESNAKEWNDFSHQTPIVRVEEGCGRMQNRLITFESGRQSCCRYRQNYDQIQGEIFSFYLSRLLGLRNLPPSSLGLVRPQDRQWINVQSSLNQAQWTEDRPVVYTQFLNDLEPAYIPVQFRGRDRHLNPSDVQRHNLQETAGRDELLTLAQWSDLLVLDYLTANLDRMVNNLYNMQWNPAMMDSPAHNLARDSKTGLLVFLDNESGLLHGYRLLDKYEMYHKSLLDSLCVFRRTTIDALRQLQSQKNVGKLLRHMFETRDQSLVDFLPFLPEKSIKTLNYRIDQVLEQVTKCQSLYGA